MSVICGWMRQIHAFLQTRDGVKQYFLSLFCYHNFRTDNFGFEIGIANRGNAYLDINDEIRYSKPVSKLKFWNNL
jgi:hypothetical protein